MKIEILLSVRIGQAKRGRGKSRKVGFDLSGIPAVTSQALDFEALCRETKINLHFIRVRYPSFVNEFVKSDSCPLSSLFYLCASASLREHCFGFRRHEAALLLGVA